MDKNFGHDAFVIVDGRIGTPVNNPSTDEPWLVWMGGTEIVKVDEVDEWFGEYDDAHQNLENALDYVGKQSVGPQQRRKAMLMFASGSMNFNRRYICRMCRVNQARLADAALSGQPARVSTLRGMEIQVQPVGKLASPPCDDVALIIEGESITVSASALAATVGHPEHPAQTGGKEALRKANPEVAKCIGVTQWTGDGIYRFAE